MKYDVFISYSREDLSLIEPFVNEIEQKAGVKCWIDWNGIESGEQFEEVVIKAIDSVDILLFFVSKNSMESTYAKLEVNYAYNTHKKVVPVVLDGGSLRGWFLFKFGAIDYIDITQKRQCDKLLRDLQAWCGVSQSQIIPIQKTAPQPVSVKTYKVGDIYDDGKKRGVVFEVSEEGLHGKIVSLTNSRKSLQWSSNEAEQKRLIGAFDEKNGANNMAKVWQIPNWQSKYPAFKWCADLGEDWYLPAKEELQAIYRHNDAINRALLSVGARNVAGYYWSSTEDNHLNGEFFAWCVVMYYGYTLGYYKRDSHYVRAVSAF